MKFHLDRRVARVLVAHQSYKLTEGSALYPEAVDLAFGPHAKHGVLIKEYRNATMQYDPSEMVGADRRPKKNMTEGERFTICTSHVERRNLTIRTFMKRFTRLALGFSKKLECLESTTAMFLAYCNFVWRVRHKDGSGKRAPSAPPPL